MFFFDISEVNIITIVVNVNVAAAVIVAIIGLNLLIGNHYFPPDTKPQIIANYFRFLENKLDTHNFRVIIVGDFNTPGFDWKFGLTLPNSHYYCDVMF
jgi:hypothetical protein